MGARGSRRRRRRSSSSSSDDDDTTSSSTFSSSMSWSSSSSPSYDDGNGISHGPSRPDLHSRHRKCHRRSESSKIRSINSNSSKRSKKRHSKDEHSSSSRGNRLQRKKHDHFIKETSTKSNQTKRTEKEFDDMDKISYSKRKKSKSSVDYARDSHQKFTNNNPLQIALRVQEKQKAMIRHNAEIAKARLASGELQRAREEQAKMLELYGAVDWRAKQKLRTEKKKLEQTVAAGKKLAYLDERENARMDAFRVALGLPTAEAQRQAEWRAEATQALFDLENSYKLSMEKRPKSMKNGMIGPALPP